MAYLKRNLEESVNRLLKIFPAVMLVGARQTGKTTLSRTTRPDWNYFDLEKGTDYDFISRDYDFFFSEYPRPPVYSGLGIKLRTLNFADTFTFQKISLVRKLENQ